MAATVAAAAASKMAVSSSTRLRIALRPLQSQRSLGSTRAHNTCSTALRTQLRLQAPSLLPGSSQWCGRRHYSTESPDASPSSTATTANSTPPSTSPPSSAVLDRYRSRLEAKAQKEGVAGFDELKEAYAHKIRALRQKDAVIMPDRPGEAKPKAKAAAAATTATPASPAEQAKEAQPSEPATATASTSAASASTASATPGPSSSPNGARPLSALLDLEKIRTLPIEELTAIWRLRFASDPMSLCAVIPAQTYAAMEAAARARPQFVLPVPHPEQGAEIHFLQWTFDDAASLKGGAASTVLFTQVAEYKLRGEFAQPHTTVTHHTDLAADCGVVLMQGQVSEGRGATADDARWLVMCLQRFYGAWAIPGTQMTANDSAAASKTVDEGARARRLLLQWFAAGDPQFTIEKLMDEVEKLG